MLGYSSIIEKLKDILSQELGNKKILDKDISAALEIDYDRFRKQKSRNGLVPYPEIMIFLAKRKISINWFFFNQLPESLIEATSDYIILKYQKSIIASAGGGAINCEIDLTSLVVDKQLLDYINSSYKYTEVLQVFGDSMEPDIKDGSLVFVDKNQVNINRPGVYVIHTPDGLHVKRIKAQGIHHYMSSINEQYTDVKLDEFQVIGEVKGLFQKF
ncbi:MAG TPA: LexA family transcriptional repressor [Sulfurimonas sp. UBA12504]|nr:MAG TPA: LexA family transcriptional repressor [Sulfurimonas sp. UBA12504]